MQPDWQCLDVFVDSNRMRLKYREFEQRLFDGRDPRDERQRRYILLLNSIHCGRIAFTLARRGCGSRVICLVSIPVGLNVARQFVVMRTAATTMRLSRLGDLHLRMDRCGERLMRMMPAAAQHGVQGHDCSNGGRNDATHSSPFHSHYVHLTLSARPSRWVTECRGKKDAARCGRSRAGRQRLAKKLFISIVKHCGH